MLTSRVSCLLSRCQSRVADRWATGVSSLSTAAASSSTPRARAPRSRPSAGSFCCAAMPADQGRRLHVVLEVQLAGPRSATAISTSISHRAEGCCGGYVAIDKRWNSPQDGRAVTRGVDAHVQQPQARVAGAQRGVYTAVRLRDARHNRMIARSAEVVRIGSCNRSLHLGAEHRRDGRVDVEMAPLASPKRAHRHQAMRDHQAGQLAQSFLIEAARSR